ncbi:hypothetical protein R6Z02_13015 [Carnobacterium maltaromaticum]|uniref:hypothetical protein n=1 Tax=Carnobacterium maltaromaticum TaxID=2751 RepID=UPI00298A3CE0|nr:hypothetical protein [Carnobacterium maltaromaticum]MDW5524673.1 hypothetical protein [Carnobacterium maltaromaticum]
MGSVYTVIASIIAAVASVIATIVVVLQGKKNRKLTSIINYKINSLDVTVKLVSEMLSNHWKLIDLYTKDRTGIITEEEQRERMVTVQKSMTLAFQTNININYKNSFSEELCDVINELQIEKEKLYSIEDDVAFFKADHTLNEPVNNIIVTMKRYVEDEWRMINKEL